MNAKSNGLIFSFSLCVLRYVDELLYWSGKRMKFDEYLQNELSPKRLPSSWVTNTKFVFQSDDGSLAILDTANDSVTTLVTNHTLVSILNAIVINFKDIDLDRVLILIFLYVR